MKILSSFLLVATILTSSNSFTTHNLGNRLLNSHAHYSLSTSSDENYEFQGKTIKKETKNGLSKAQFEAEAARSAINSLLFPERESSERDSLARTAQGVSVGEAISANDTRLQYTYHEFPLESYDILMNRAMILLFQYEAEARERSFKLKAGGQGLVKLEEKEAALIRYQVENQPYERPLNKRQIRHAIDIGSGCGRLVLYSSLTGLGFGSEWVVHGIEILEELHEKAVQSLEKGVYEGLFYHVEDDKTEMDLNMNAGHNTLVSFHRGPAADYAHILKKASVLFCYSTVLPANDFSMTHKAPMLGPEWSQMLARSCSEGCIVVTTDRVLNSNDGFVLLDRMDVENPSLMGSTGYIHILDKSGLLFNDDDTTDDEEGPFSISLYPKIES